MYFGSVRFFKHLILVTVLLIIVGLLSVIVWSYLVNEGLRSAIVRSDLVNEDLREQIAQIMPSAMLTSKSEAMDYQALYPELHATLPAEYHTDPNTIYLTFDDGPSARTPEILDVLKEKDVKATFFVIGKTGEADKAILKRIVDEGHTIGIHSFSHKYTTIYASVENYLADFDKIYTHIYETTGVRADIGRYPGGSINQYNSLIYTEISSEMTRRGFIYYDWNASSGDTLANATKNTVLSNSISSVGDKNRAILLLHDSSNKSATVAALPDIIDNLKSKGYRFDKLSNEIRPINFAYK